MKKTAACILAFVFSVASVNYVNAEEEVFSSETIPVRMAPNTIIEYINDHEYKIIQGGQYVVPKRSEQEFDENSIVEENGFCEVPNPELLPDGAIVIEPTLPSAGLRVIYKSNGYIRIVEEPNNSARLSRNAKGSASTRGMALGEYAAPGTYYWGDYNNVRINSFNKLVQGSGRLTTYNDTIGDHNNALKKGDVAVKWQYLNPPHNTIINVRAQKKGSGSVYGDNPTGPYVTVRMTKNDIGSLPNAALDIWKTGVEFFDYEYNSNVTLSGQYCFYR